MIGLESSPTHATTFRVTTPTRSNARTWARKFEARLLEPGIVSYEDSGCGKAFLTKEDIDASIHTFIGRPLILTPKLKHKRVTPAELEKEARGYITETFYNPADGWFWCRGICHSDEAKDAIDSVGFCSCAYEVEKVGPGGEYHAIPYQERIVQFSGEHLAIVDRPRYEGAIIRLNSKTKKTTMFKWIQKIASRSNSAEAPVAPAAAAPAAPAAPAIAPAAAEPVVKENAQEIGADTELEIPSRENGKTEKITLGALIESHRARENGLNPEDHLEVDGNQVTVADIIAGFKANAVKVNAEAEESDEEKEKKKKAKENAAPAPTPAADAPKHFKVLMNARDNGFTAEGPKAEPDDMLSRCNRGSSRYGSPSVAGKN